MADNFRIHKKHGLQVWFIVALSKYECQFTCHWAIVKEKKGEPWDRIKDKSISTREKNTD